MQQDRKLVNNADAKPLTVQDAYLRLRLQYSSVGDDIGQIYLVHGDSLLLDIFSHPLLDWTHGGQLLQFFYQAECALQSFAHRGRVFKVVFFDCLSCIWSNPTVQFARELLIDHIRKNTKIDVERFSTWEDSAWKEFVSFTRPSFVLMCSARAGILAEKMRKGFVTDTEKLIQRMAVDFIIRQNIECVSMTEVSFKSSSMFGFRFNTSRELKNSKIDYPPIQKTPTYMDKKVSPDADLVKKIAAEFKEPWLNLTIYYLICILKGNKSLLQACLAKSFLLHAAAIRTLPLEARAQALPEDVKQREIFQKFIADICGAALHKTNNDALESLGGHGIWRCDLFDGRMFEKIAILTACLGLDSLNTFGVSKDMLGSLRKAWTFIHIEARLNKKHKIKNFTPIWKKNQFPEFSAFCKSEMKNSKDIKFNAEHLEIKLEKLDQKTIGASEAGETKAKEKAEEKKEEDKEEEVAEAWDDDDAEDGVADDWEAEDDGAEEEEKTTEPEEENNEIEQTDEGGLAKTSNAPLMTKAQVLWNRNEIKDVKVFSLKDAKMVQTFAPEIEAQLQTRNVTSEEKIKSPYTRNGIWLLDKEIDDGTNPPPEPEPQTKWERRKATQRKMRYIAYLDKYAKSLKGGGIIYRDVVVAQRSDEKKKEKKSKKQSSKKGSKKGGKGGKGKGKMTMRDKIRADVEEKQREKALNDVKCYINHASSLKTLEQRIEHLDKVLISMSEPYAVVPGLMKLLEWCVEAWKLEKAKGGMGAAVRVFQMVMDIFRRFQKDISIDQFKELSTVLLRLGFSDAAELLVDQFIKLRPEKLSKKDLVVSLPKTKELAVGLPSYRFQLMYAGHLMVRNVDSAPDDRVSGFYPDKWQRDLLDVVDKKESALVVAPTSSGKTFVSYYAMKQALFDNKNIKRSTDRSIIVYVSPTKALVNQVAADVYARYGAVFGVMTLEYSQRLKDCEVLITIPECLETLLLSPQSAMWARCIKYVVFDEVHCLGSTENGDVWERLLMMVRCPFIALSATLGNPEEFSGWLSRIQATHDRKVNLIIHRTRWSDLIKYMYLPKSLPPLTAIQGQKHLPSFEYVHPCSALGTELARTGFPPDLGFSPKDCMLLYDAIIGVEVPDDVKKRVQALHPLNFFKDLLYIKKVDAQRFEKALKQELYLWSKNGMKKEILELIGRLTKALDSGIKTLEEATEGLCYSVDYLKEHFMALMVDLLNADFLPAVVFNLNRDVCEDLVVDMLFTLEDMEEKALEAEGFSGKKKQKDLSKLKKQAKRARDKKDRNKDEDAQPGDEEEEGQFVEEEPLYHVDPRFSFIQDGQSMEMGEMEWWLNRLLYKTKWSRTHPLIRALQRGIGVHHDELHRAYKDLVETLFRTKHLKIVVATSTLALGVNMPARTTVFCGDNPNLDPLRYRQMAGRAGRRGYDNIGNVVFVGISPKKVFRLMTSSLVSLHGHFPMTPTVVLRMVNLHGKVNHKTHAKDILLNLLKEPFFKNKNEISKQAKMHFRFTLQYLLEQDLIKIDPKTGLQVHGAGALAVHLRFAQPGNMLFVKLWDMGVFEDICSTFHNKGEQSPILHKLMLVMAHIFFRQPLPVGFTKKDLLIQPEQKSTVVLKILPPKVQKILDQQKKSALRLYRTYLQHTYLPEVESETHPISEALPISNLDIKPSTVSPGSFLSKVSLQRVPAAIRSPYFRLSGAKDDFKSAAEICQSVPSKLYMDLEAFPVCEYTDRQLRNLPLNAYATDFFRHGSLALLQTDNGLGAGKAWALLKKWSHLLQDIAQAVTELQRPTDRATAEAEYYGTAAVIEKNNTSKAFSVLSTQFNEMFENWNHQQTNQRKKLEDIKKVVEED